MPDDRAFLESYDGVELELPTGETLRCRPLTLRQAAKYLRLLTDAQAGDTRAMLDVIEQFPKDVGAEEALDKLTPVELVELISVFFTSRPSRKAAENGQSDSTT